MIGFFILLLGIALFAQWQRIGKLERRIEDWERTHFHDSTGTEVVEPAQKQVTPTRPAPIDSEGNEADSISEGPLEEAAKIAAFEARPEAAQTASVERLVAMDADAGSEIGTDETAIDAANIDQDNFEEPISDDTPRFQFDFEDIFGRRLPIWAGGFALAIAGIFLVRYSIEAGLVTPAVRVAMSFVFGVGLLAGAEAAFRMEQRIADPRVRQALAGAGLATLYGAFYLAGTAYGLIGAGSAFVGLAVVTAAAIALSFRFGLPCAVIGLVGGFAAPLLVDSDSSNIPLLSFYLALITGGLAWTGQVQGRTWLGYAALALGLVWGALMMFAGVDSSSDFAALGVYLVVLGTVLPAFLHASGGPSLPKLAAGAIATLQMAVLVSNAGFAPLTWGLYLLIGAAMAALGWRYPALRLGSLVGAGLGLWLLLIWPEPDTQFFAIIAAAMVVIFAGVPLALHWRRQANFADLAQLSAVALIMGGVIYSRFGSWGELASEPILAAAMAALALLPAAAFALLWQRGQEGDTRTALTLLAPAAILTFAALLLIGPTWLAPVMAMLVSAGMLALLWKRQALSLDITAWSAAAITVIALVVTPEIESEIVRLGEASGEVPTGHALLRWAAATLPFLGLALISRTELPRRVAEGLAVAFAYGTLAQVIPPQALAWLAAAGAIALLLWQSERLAAWATALAIAGMWAFVPLVYWFGAGAEAFASKPFYSTSAVSPLDIILRLAPFAAGLGLLFWKKADDGRAWQSGTLAGLGLLGVVSAHSLYKLGFDITSMLQFELYGMGERTVWQALLMLAAYGASQLLPSNLRRPVSLALIAASLAHFAWFTLMLHNPLWAVQNVGPTPIANWILPAYFTAIAGLWLGHSQWPAAPSYMRRTVDGVTMGFIALLALSLLRQMFAGSDLTAVTIGQNESLLISLLGIVLALAYLWWGSVRDTRSWRIGSLVLMLGAVLKVFLIDAAALEGLLRIASFMALGFSLIGIGWVYSRQLKSREGGTDTTTVAS